MDPYKVKKIVREQAQFTPDLPATRKGPTSSSNPNWVSNPRRPGLDADATLVDNHPRPDAEDPYYTGYGMKTVSLYGDEQLNAEVLPEGYVQEFKDPADNEYTSQHFVGFYNEEEVTDKITGKKVKGFLERHNYRDTI